MRPTKASRCACSTLHPPVTQAPRTRPAMGKGGADEWLAGPPAACSRHARRALPRCSVQRAAAAHDAVLQAQRAGQQQAQERDAACVRRGGAGPAWSMVTRLRSLPVRGLARFSHSRRHVWPAWSRRRCRPRRARSAGGDGRRARWRGPRRRWRWAAQDAERALPGAGNGAAGQAQSAGQPDASKLSLRQGAHQCYTQRATQAAAAPRARCQTTWRVGTPGARGRLRFE
jgi:hypothetical protein